jgi:hypothetical protein
MKEFDIEKAIDYLQHYVNTYKSQPCYKDYTEETWIEDILYGLGVSVSNEFMFADGFHKFKCKLIKEDHFK